VRIAISNYLIIKIKGEGKDEGFKKEFAVD
jgi:hypothetical protein